MFSLINKLKQLYKPLADRKRSYAVYENGNGNFHILAIDFDGGFIVADDIPSFRMAELIAELLNLTAEVATKRSA